MAGVVVQPPEALVAPVIIQQVVLNKEAWLSNQIENIKEEELGAVFEACGKTAKNKTDKVDKTKLPELLVEKVVKMNFPAVPTTWEPMATVLKLNFKVINLPDKLIFAA